MGLKNISGMNDAIKGIKSLAKGLFTGVSFLYSVPTAYTVYDMHNDPGLQLRLMQNQTQVDNISNHAYLAMCKAVAVISLPYKNVIDDIYSGEQSDKAVIAAYNENYKACLTSVLIENREEYNELHKVQSSL